MSENNQAKKSVLVTGSSSGIGRAVAVYLAERGYAVLATVRREFSFKDLNSLHKDHLIPMYPLDLTNEDHIEKMADSIKESVRKHEIPSLYAVVNAAGGGSITPIELMDVQDLRQELETRIVGPVSLIQRLLPLLRTTRGRILWIATPGLFPIPFVSDIHAPDFAVNYIARTLNLELMHDGIKNILIRCGGIETPSARRTEENLGRMLAEWPKARVQPYEKRLRSTLDDLRAFDKKRTSPVKIAAVVCKAIEKRNPKTRYQVGYMSRAGAFLEHLPQSWVDYIMRKREE